MKVNHENLLESLVKVGDEWVPLSKCTGETLPAAIRELEQAGERDLRAAAFLAFLRKLAEKGLDKTS